MSAAEDVQVGSCGGRRDLDADVAVADVGQEVLVLAGARGGRVVAGVRLQRVQGVRVGVELVAHARLPRVVVGGERRGRGAAGIENNSLWMVPTYEQRFSYSQSQVVKSSANLSLMFG